MDAQVLLSSQSNQITSWKKQTSEATWCNSSAGLYRKFLSQNLLDAERESIREKDCYMLALLHTLSRASCWLLLGALFQGILNAFFCYCDYDIFLYSTGWDQSLLCLHIWQGNPSSGKQAFSKSSSHISFSDIWSLCITADITLQFSSPVYLYFACHVILVPQQRLDV